MKGRKPVRVRVYRATTDVAAAILAAVEGGILPPGTSPRNRPRVVQLLAQCAGHDARLYGRQDACHYAKQILVRARGGFIRLNESDVRRPG